MSTRWLLVPWVVLFVVFMVLAIFSRAEALPAIGPNDTFFTDYERFLCDTKEELQSIYDVAKDNIFLARDRFDELAAERNEFGEARCVLGIYPMVDVISIERLGPIPNYVGDVALAAFAIEIAARGPTQSDRRFWILYLDMADAVVPAEDQASIDAHPGFQFVVNDAADVIANAPQNACLKMAPEGAKVIRELIPDGMGDFIVWIADQTNSLWLCDVSMSGAVFAMAKIQGDILLGSGPDIGIPASPGDPMATAVALCTFTGLGVEDMVVIAAVPDGSGDYLVWLKNEAGGLWMCDASGDNKLYVFTPVDMPINGDIGPLDRSNI